MPWHKDSDLHLQVPGLIKERRLLWSDPGWYIKIVWAGLFVALYVAKQVQDEVERRAYSALLKQTRKSSAVLIQQKRLWELELVLPKDVPTESRSQKVRARTIPHWLIIIIISWCQDSLSFKANILTSCAVRLDLFYAVLCISIHAPQLDFILLNPETEMDLVWVIL